MLLEKGRFIDCLRPVIMYGTILFVYGRRLYYEKTSVVRKMYWLNLHTSTGKKFTTCLLMLLHVCMWRLWLMRFHICMALTGAYNTSKSQHNSNTQGSLVVIIRWLGNVCKLCCEGLQNPSSIGWTWLKWCTVLKWTKLKLRIRSSQLIYIQDSENHDKRVV